MPHPQSRRPLSRGPAETEAEHRFLSILPLQNQHRAGRGEGGGGEKLHAHFHSHSRQEFHMGPI